MMGGTFVLTLELAWLEGEQESSTVKLDFNQSMVSADLDAYKGISSRCLLASGSAGHLLCSVDSAKGKKERETRGV